MTMDFRNIRHRIIPAVCLTIALIAAVPEAYSKKPKRDINKVRSEQQTNKREIKETSKKITVNTRETQRQLSRLNTLSGEITAKNEEIGRIQAGVDSIDRDITVVNDSISTLGTRLGIMRDAYARQLRDVQQNATTMSTLSFIFSAESFTTAWQRVRYLRQLTAWRRRKAAEMRAVTDSLSARRTTLDTLRQTRRTAIARLSLAKKQLDTKRQETDKIVVALRSEGQSLKALLKEKERKARALDNELDKLIAEEQRREEQRRKEEQRKAAAEKKAKAAAGKQSGSTAASSSASKTTPAKPKTEAPAAMAEADRKLSGSFESNKGRLLFPVAGKYRIARGFGRQKHPELEHVETDNSGIDIESLGAGKARAVFDGRVSEIFKQPGYNTIVMIRHGNYLTIYANLSDIQVKKGDTVKAGQTIGTIFADPEEDGRLILHFELRKERTKLNPLLWVK